MSEGNAASDVVLTEDKPAKERLFTAAETEQIVRDRLKRVKTEKQPAVDDNLVNDLKTKYDTQVEQTKQLSQKLNNWRQQSLRATVQAKLAEAGCLEPELIADSFLLGKRVKLDDDDKVVVSNAENNLDKLIQETLASKPHLVRASGPGLGSKAPQVLETDPSDIRQMTKEQLRARLGGSSVTKNFLSK